MAKQSAGLLMLRLVDGELEFLLAHPGGPYFRAKDLGAWTIPKGLVKVQEAPIDAARREFGEETGFAVPQACVLRPLGSVVQKGGKIVHGWAFFGDCDPSELHSNLFELEWPPRSGHRASFREIDRVEFFGEARARAKILDAQTPFLDRALEVV